MSKQVRIRRDSSSNLAVVTPADSELGHDTTLDELIIGDGTTTGGIPHPNFRSIINNRYVSANAGGTGDAITLSLTRAPASYATYMRVIFKAGANNTGAATVNINSLGAKNIQKVSGGSLAALAAGDISSGGVYEIIYDGTQFQLLNLQNSGITSVSQGDLNTSTGTFSQTPSTVLTGAFRHGNAGVAAPGGQYGFFAQHLQSSNQLSGWWVGGTSSSYVTTLVSWNSVAAASVSGQQRYVTSSPPFDLGHGEVGGFIYLLLSSSGDLLGHYSADVPQWAYNGPTNIRCTHKDHGTGKKYRTVMKKRSIEELMDGASIQYELEEITQAIKNADMDLIPNPFGEIRAGEKVVLLDPMDDRVRKLIDLQNSGGADEVIEAITKGKIYADNQELSRNGPRGVMQARLKYKYSG